MSEIKQESVSIKLGKQQTEPITYSSTVTRLVGNMRITWLFKGFSTIEDALLFSCYSYIHNPNVVISNNIVYNIPKFPYEFKEFEDIEYDDFQGYHMLLVNENLVFEKERQKKSFLDVGLKYKKNDTWFRSEMLYSKLQLERLQEFIKVINSKE